MLRTGEPATIEHSDGRTVVRITRIMYAIRSYYGFSDMNGLLAAAQIRSIVFGVRDLGSASFYAVPVTASLLGLDYALVSGYVGTASRVLAVIRGEA